MDVCTIILKGLLLDKKVKTSNQMTEGMQVDFVE